MIPNDNDNPSATVRVIIVRGSDSTEPTLPLAPNCRCVWSATYIDWEACCVVDPSPYLWPTYGQFATPMPVEAREPSGHRPRQLESSYG